MSGKRMKLEFATITVAGYYNSIKVTNAITYKIMAINGPILTHLLRESVKISKSLFKLNLTKETKQRQKPR